MIKEEKAGLININVLLRNKKSKSFFENAKTHISSKKFKGVKTLSKDIDDIIYAK